MAAEIVVTPAALPYLRLQKGSVQPAPDDEWIENYRSAVRRDFEDILPHLPAKCGVVLDIGGGMGGVDVLIARHYGRRQPAIAILDGIDDPPVMKLHRETFNDMAVTAEFLKVNGVRTFEPLGPAAAGAGVKGTADLVLSLGSWCFHYPPGEYLAFALASKPQAVILDVRRGKPEWLAQLVAAFGPATTIRKEKKFRRVVFTPS